MTMNQARKALRALRGIVKLQALARGYLVRKRAATTLGLMQSLFRAQSMVRSQRAQRSIDKENQNPMENRPRRSTVWHGLFDLIPARNMLLILKGEIFNVGVFPV